MKTNVLQLTEAYVADNKQYISGNVAEHLVTNADNMENGYLEYLTDEEIEEYENDADMRNYYEECVVNFCWENFDYYLFATLSDDKKSVNFPSGGQLDTWQVSAICERGSDEEIREYLQTQEGWEKESIDEFIKFKNSDLIDKMEF